jgi:heat shock protein HslJ
MHLAGLPLVLLLAFAMTLDRGTPLPGDARAISPVVWEVVALPGDATPIATAERSRYTIQFLPDRTVAVRADCNQATGTYEIADDAMSISMTASTLALCPSGSHGEDFLEMLGAITTRRAETNGDLLLSGPAGTIRLQPTLSGVIWEWLGLEGGDGSVVTPKDPSRYTLAFMPEGKLVIRADCNRALGSYTIEGSRINLTLGGVTRALCAPGSLMDDYLRDLDLVSSHVFRDGNLYLALPVDAGILEFRARVDEAHQATPRAG